LKALILWSLSSSEAVQAKIKESYKQARHDDDLNQPLSVQPWGRDSLKRRYWLIEGHDDTNFRLYRESNPALKHNTWWSIAGSIPELEAVVEKLEGEKGTHSKKLSERIRASIPRFEASEEVISYFEIKLNPANESSETETPRISSRTKSCLCSSGSWIFHV
jgi:hypothetical protein